jgi:hypothetical protein
VKACIRDCLVAAILNKKAYSSFPESEKNKVQTTLVNFLIFSLKKITAIVKAKTVKLNREDDF